MGCGNSVRACARSPAWARKFTPASLGVDSRDAGQEAQSFIEECNGVSEKRKERSKSLPARASPRFLRQKKSIRRDRNMGTYFSSSLRMSRIDQDF